MDKSEGKKKDFDDNSVHDRFHCNQHYYYRTNSGSAQPLAKSPENVFFIWETGILLQGIFQLGKFLVLVPIVNEKDTGNRIAFISKGRTSSSFIPFSKNQRGTGIQEAPPTFMTILLPKPQATLSFAGKSICFLTQKRSLHVDSLSSKGCLIMGG